MIEPPQLIQTTVQITAAIHLTIPRVEMQTAFGPAVAELMAILKAQGTAPAGPVFAHHHRMDPETFDFDLGVPVDRPVSASGRVRPGALPAVAAVRTVYHGPYEGLPAAWGELMAWMDRERHAAADDLWESYIVHPDNEPDPAAWRTELVRPVKA